HYRYPSNRIIADDGLYARITFRPNANRTGFGLGDRVQCDLTTQDELGLMMASELRPRVYLFDAVRVPSSRSPAGSTTQLSSDAANLPEVLSTLQPKPNSFKEYVDQVTKVLPIVKWVDVVPSGTESEIRIWNVDPTDKDDLPNPLSECGTGVGQV